MKAMNVPIASITDLKKAPMEIIQQAEKEKNGVYILNHNKNVGVIMTAEQYEAIIRRIEELEDENTVLPRLMNENRVVLSDEEVRGKKTVQKVTPKQEDDDGWA